MKKLAFSIMSLSVALALSACGGGDGDKRSDAELYSHYAQGKFIDSAVAGVDVIQDGQSLGLTDKNGIFQYKINGGQLTFQVGKVILGHTKPKAIVTPEDLTNDTEKQTKILQVLQSLDDDLNAENGINIKVETSAKLEKPMNLLADGVTPLEVLQQAIPNSPHVVPAEKARAHFEKTKKELAKQQGYVPVDKTENKQGSTTSNKTENKQSPATADQLVGYWRSDCVTEGNTSELTFLKIKKVGDSLIQHDTKIVKKFNNDSCLGDKFVYEYDNSEKNEPTPVDDSITQNGNGSFSVSYKEGGKLIKETYRPISKDVFDSEKKQVNAENLHSDKNDTSKNNYLVGYWQSECFTSSHTVFSEITYFKVSGYDDDNKKIVKKFSSKNCSGDSVISEKESELSIHSSYRITQENNNRFSVSYKEGKEKVKEIFNRVQEQQFNQVKAERQQKVQQAEMMTDQLVGYWKSQCRPAVYPNPNVHSEISYMTLSKHNNHEMKIENHEMKVENKIQGFASSDCSGEVVSKFNISWINKNKDEGVLSLTEQFVTLQGNGFVHKYGEQGKILVDTYHRVSEQDVPKGFQ